MSKERKVNWVSILFLLGFVVMLGLWDSGWKPHWAFLVGIFVMLSPGFLMACYRLYDRRESLKDTYEQAKMLFRAQRLINEENKKNKGKKEGKK